MTPKLGSSLLILIALAGCRDATAPFNPTQEPAVLARQGEVQSDSTPPRILQQAPTAPRLGTYQVSFWAKRGTETAVAVDYRRRGAGAWSSDPFLQFLIPANGLLAGADGVPLQRGDSVRITLTIDSTSFLVDFEPSGVMFSKAFPARLVFWYQHADPDFNGDGVVDTLDEALGRQLAIWSESSGKGGKHGSHRRAWRQLSTKNDATLQFVSSDVHHFSQYAVSF